MQERLNFLPEMQSVTVNYFTATTDSLQPFYMVTNTVCSLFSFFPSFYLLLIQLIEKIWCVHFSWKFSTFFHIVSIKTLFQNCILVKKIAEIYLLGGAIVLFAAYSIYALIFNTFAIKFFVPF